MPVISKPEWNLKRLKKENEICEKFILHKNELSEEKKILLALEYVEAKIYPYSLDGRCGFKKYLKKAMKIVRKYYKEHKEEGESNEKSN